MLGPNVSPGHALEEAGLTVNQSFDPSIDRFEFLQSPQQGAVGIEYPKLIESTDPHHIAPHFGM